jgi:hypothetical protein
MPVYAEEPIVKVTDERIVHISSCGGVTLTATAGFRNRNWVRLSIPGAPPVGVYASSLRDALNRLEEVWEE